MKLEFLKNIFPSGKSAAEVKPLSPDLKELVLEKQRILTRIANLESDMNLAASDKDVYSSSDGGLLDDLKEKNKQVVGKIYNLCLKYGENSRRFLSEDEIGGVLSEANNNLSPFS